VELCLPGPDCPADFDPLAEGKVLVDLYLEIGDLKRVRSLLEKLLRLQPEDQDLKKALVNVHTRNGDTKRVIELYESMAEDLVRSRRPLEAVGYLQKILMLDRSRADVSERMRALYEFDERSRSRRRSLTVLGAVFLALIGLGVAYWFYDRTAQEDFERIDVRKLVEAREFTKAAAMFERFVQDHPLTLSVPRAEEELLRIESARKKYEAKLAQDRMAKDRELARLRAEYRTDWSRYRDQFMSRDPDAALASLDRVRQKVRQAGEEDDLAWALEEQVEKTWMKLHDFLTEADKLSAEVGSLLDAGEWQQARQKAVELATRYEITRAARETRIPVEFRSRPVGAKIIQGGRPVERTQKGVTEPLMAPAVVLCRPGEETFTFELAGFEPCTFTVDARKQAVAEQVMKVVAERTIRFPAVVQTAVGSGGPWLVAGLRDGRIGIANGETARVEHVIPLGGLKAVESTPVINGDRAFFLSNEGTLECVLLKQGQLAPRWPVRLDRAAMCEPVVGDGRVLVCDRENTLLCYDQVEAKLLWSLPLRNALVGRPALGRRNVVAGTSDGRVFVVETTSGKVANVWKCPVGITTRVLSAEGALYFGCADGTVRAVEEGSGQTLWVHKMGRVVTDGELEVAGTNLVALAADNELVLLSRANDGQERAKAKLPGIMQKGILVAGDRIVLTTRTPKERSRGASDAIQARDLTDLTPLWDYQDTGVFAGAPTAGSRGIVLADSNGEVVLFR
jgi:outer membrane protein assembly factor BamB